LLQTLTKLRDLGTLIVVEHDEETIRAADHIVDIGPGAGSTGADYRAGDLEAMLGADSSLTGAYLSGRRLIETPVERRQGMGIASKTLTANLKHINVEIPLGSSSALLASPVLANHSN